MSRSVGRRALASLLAALATATAGAEDWPQFRGPTGQGHSSETGLPVEWGETENVAWKVAIAGEGWSSPVVVDERVWLTTSTTVQGAVSLRVLAFDVATGDRRVETEVFRVARPNDRNPKNSHASPTAIVEGDRVYVHFGAEGTAALRVDGSVVWRRQLPYRSQHGNGGSAALDGDLLILSCDGDDRAFVVALDKATGKTRWRVERPSPAAQAYSTPLVIEVAGKRQVVSVGAFRTIAYDPKDGSEVWRVRYGDGFSNVPRPVFAHGLVLLSRGFNEAGLLAVRPDGRGDVTETHVVWRMSRAAPHTPSPLVVGDEVYVVSDGGVVSCLRADTGELIWRERLRGNYSASPVYADGRIYFQSEEGLTTVVAPGHAFQELGRSQLDGATLASMAVADGSLFIRSREHLYRIRSSPGSPAVSGR